MGFETVDGITLTTDHAASSYGRPVLVLDGQAFGPADMTPAGVAGAELALVWAERFANERVAALLTSNDFAELRAAAASLLAALDRYEGYDLRADRLRRVLLHLEGVDWRNGDAEPWDVALLIRLHRVPEFIRPDVLAVLDGALRIIEGGMAEDAAVDDRANDAAQAGASAAVA